MSNIQSIVALKNVKLFQNQKDEVQVSLKKDVRVKAELSYFEAEGELPYDIRVAPLTKSDKTGREFIKVSLSTGKGDQRQYFSGLLNVVKKEGSDFSHAGTIDVDGIRTIKMMVRKPAEGKSYYTVKFSKEKDSAFPNVSATLPVPATVDAEGFPI